MKDAKRSRILKRAKDMVQTGDCWYSFARINSSVHLSPAMAAHLTERLWDISDIVKLIEEWETQTCAAF